MQIDEQGKLTAAPEEAFGFTITNFPSDKSWWALDHVCIHQGVFPTLKQIIFFWLVDPPQEENASIVAIFKVKRK